MSIQQGKEVTEGAVGLPAHQEPQENQDKKVMGYSGDSCQCQYFWHSFAYLTGDVGSKGEIGFQGVKGDNGEKGEPGQNGTVGEKGQPGKEGPVGPPGVALKGEKGDKGECGTFGERGQKGERGDPGSPGIPGAMGIPGINGKHGSPGPVGVRGDPGSPGPRGEPGVRGSEGAQGVRGLVGPKGDRGYPGKRGERGFRGLKGAKGSGTAQKRSAFSVGLSPRKSFPPSGFPIRFDKVFYNAENHFNFTSNSFTCVHAGVYVFSFHITVRNQPLRATLVVNGSRRVRTRDSLYGQDIDQASTLVVLRLAVGDEVWMETFRDWNGAYASSEDDSIFSGFLLYSDDIWYWKCVFSTGLLDCKKAKYWWCKSIPITFEQLFKLTDTVNIYMYCIYACIYLNLKTETQITKQAIRATPIC